MPKMERIIYVPQQEESQAAQLLLTDPLDMGPIMQQRGRHWSAGWSSFS